jgi:hypothetical protein
VKIASKKGLTLKADDRYAKAYENVVFEGWDDGGHCPKMLKTDLFMVF